MSNLDDLLAEAEKILDKPDEHPYRPVLMLEIVVALVKELRSGE